MKEFELLDIIAIVYLCYQADSNAQLRGQSTNDDILNEMKILVTRLIEQNNEIIKILKDIKK